MTTENPRIIVVTGATGLQGGAVTRHLLANNWKVRAVTRNTKSKKAKNLSDLGAEIAEGNLSDPNTLRPIFKGSYGIFSVQNPVISGVEEEINQGRNVADVARQMGVQHLIYSSAGIGVKGTGIPSWESKMVIEEYIKSLQLP